MQAPDHTPGPAVSDEGGDWVREAFHSHQAALVAYVEQVLGDPDLARDVVQDAFLRLCREADDRLRARVVPWLYTVCRRRALDLWRKDRRMQPIDETQAGHWPDTEPAPDATAARQEEASRAARLLARLPPPQREVLVLKFQQALSYREISEITGLSVGHVGFLIHTALKSLRRRLNTESAPAPAPERTP